MKIRSLVLVLPLLAGLLAAAPARAEGPREAARRLRIDAQFDRARANEFRKFANEDEGVARARMAQAADLDNNANGYAARANFHNNLANQFNNPEQRQLAQACAALATDMHRLAGERRNLAASLQAHVNQWRQWATAMDQRAQRNEYFAQQLENSGAL